MRVDVSVPVDYVIGHLRYGHFEAQLDLTDEEYKEFESNPKKFFQNHEKHYYDLRDSHFVVDDYEIDDIGGLDFNVITYIPLD